MYCSDARGIDAVVIFEVVCYIIRDGDNDFTVRDRAVIEALCFAADVIGGVAGCYEMCVRFLAGAPGTPGGGAAAGMNDADIIAFNQFFKAVNVLPHNNGVFTVYG